MRVLLLAVLLVAAAACGPIYDTQYSFVPPDRPDGGACLAQCRQLDQYCRRTCSLEERACVAEERRDAMRAYDDYVRERQAAKQPVKRARSDFDRSWQCRNSSCEAACESDHRACYTGCGGRVIPRRVCVMFCE